MCAAAKHCMSATISCGGGESTCGTLTDFVAPQDTSWVHDIHGVRIICWHNQVRQGTICGPPSLVAYKGGVTTPCPPRQPRQAAMCSQPCHFCANPIPAHVHLSSSGSGKRVFLSGGPACICHMAHGCNPVRPILVIPKQSVQKSICHTSFPTHCARATTI